jgi:hypothetical protein
MGHFMLDSYEIVLTRIWVFDAVGRENLGRGPKKFRAGINSNNINALWCLSVASIENKFMYVEELEKDLFA